MMADEGKYTNKQLYDLWDMPKEMCYAVQQRLRKGNLLQQVRSKWQKVLDKDT
jgi:hypothetical protein